MSRALGESHAYQNTERRDASQGGQTGEPTEAKGTSTCTSSSTAGQTKGTRSAMPLEGRGKSGEGEKTGETKWHPHNHQSPPSLLLLSTPPKSRCAVVSRHAVHHLTPFTHTHTHNFPNHRRRPSSYKTGVAAGWPMYVVSSFHFFHFLLLFFHPLSYS